MINPKPIGLFDSGVGGISIMKEVRRFLPSENLLYYADSIYCPYGSKPPRVIRSRAFAIVDFMISKDAKMIVVASNTTTVSSLEAVRQRYNIPVVGVEPAVKPAVKATRNGRIGVLATGVTLAGERFSKLVERFGNGVEVYTQPCPGLVELVESGKCIHVEAESMLKIYLEPLLSRGADTIVLGCTHYPFLKPLVEKLSGPGIEIIDTGEAVARQVVRVLDNYGLASGCPEAGSERFFTSGCPEQVEPVVRLLWGNESLTVEHAAI